MGKKLTIIHFKVKKKMKENLYHRTHVFAEPIERGKFSPITYIFEALGELKCRTHYGKICKF